MLDIEATGLPPTNDLESAILRTLDPGLYTAVVNGKNGATGVGLVEAYDLDLSALSQLGNLSTRGFVGTGANVMIGGFILGGGGKDVGVVVRALGPSLTAFGVTGALADPTLVTRMANVVGGQSVVTVLDVRRDKSGAPVVWTHNGQRRTDQLVSDAAKLMAESGAGEIIVNSIDNDGAMQGYDLPLVAEVLAAVSVPVTALGGAGSLAHIKTLIERFGLIGAAAGSLFVFKGVYRAVLINYPSRVEKDALMAGLASNEGGPP